MKRTLSVALLSIFAAASSFAGQARVYSYQVTVPFDFMANGHYVRAGQVRIEVDKSNVRLVTADKGTIAVIQMHGIATPKADASLYFKKTGWAPQLAAVKDPSTGKVRAL